MENVGDSESVSSAAPVIKSYVLIKAATDGALETVALAALHEVGARFNVHPYYLRAQTRIRRISKARHEAYRAVMAATGWNQTEVAKFFGRHPSSVSHSLTTYGGD